MNNLPVGVLIYKRADLRFASLAARKLLLGSSSGEMVELKRVVERNDQLRVAVGSFEESKKDNNDTALEHQTSQVHFLADAGSTKPLGVSTITLGMQDEPYKVCIMQDQSLYVELEKEKVAKQYMKNFFAMITHELRNPLHGVLGVFEGLLSEVPQEEMKGQCTMGINTVKLMMRLVNDMLDLSQLESNKFRLVNNEADVLEMLHECLEIMQFKYRSKGLALTHKVCGSIPKLKCDQNRYKQILLNLLGNAVKFTERGGVSVTLFYDQISHQLITTVKDTGVGIREEDKYQLFSFFGKLEDSVLLSPQSAGLGLHICKKLSEAMGGFIKLDSEYRKGTTITFAIKNQFEPESEAELMIGSNILITIPIERDPSEITGELESNTFSPTPFSTIARTPSRSRPGPILVVDDEPLCANIMASYCKTLGFTTDTAYSASQAIELIRKKYDKKTHKGYKLVFMDVNMPGKDGLEATKEIKRIHKYLYVIGVTGDSSVEIEKKCKTAGMDQICRVFVIKPASKDLVSKVLLELKKKGKI